MEFKGNEHIYKVIPDILGNEKSDNPAILHLKGISQEAFSKAVREESIIGQNHTREEASRLIAENAQRLISERVVKIENLTIDGQEITDYAGLAKHGPRELINWLVAAVHSTEILTEYEIKN